MKEHIANQLQSMNIRTLTVNVLHIKIVNAYLQILEVAATEYILNMSYSKSQLLHTNCQ